MVFSIVIATLNSEKYINQTLNSIKNQNFKNFELIIVDKNSSDKTIDIIKKYKFKNIKIIRKNDKGIYDALNIGIRNSKGAIISILHSNDQFFKKTVLNDVYDAFKLNDVDIIYGDLVYYDKKMKKLLRYWKSGNFKNFSFNKGWSPPHPSFFVKRKIYLKYGLYKTNIGTSSDIELMYRFLQKKKISFKYLNKILIKMRYGGKSNESIKTIINQNIKIIKFLKLNSLYKIIYYLANKILNRINQFFIKP